MPECVSAISLFDHQHHQILRARLLSAALLVIVQLGCKCPCVMLISSHAPVLCCFSRGCQPTQITAMHTHTAAEQGLQAHPDQIQHADLTHHHTLYCAGVATSPYGTLPEPIQIGGQAAVRTGLAARPLNTLGCRPQARTPAVFSPRLLPSSLASRASVQSLTR